MWCDNCESDPCACQKPAQPRAYHAAPTYDFTHAISKQEFGLDLFNCIKAFGSRELYREWYKVTCTDLRLTVAQRKKKLADLKAKECQQEAIIHALMPKLTTEDQRTLLQRYEALAA